MEKKYEIKLSFEELKLLDGKVSEEAQKIIEIAKQEAVYGFPLPVMNEILRKSLEIGKLTWRYKSIRDCNYCDKKRDYYRYPRSGRYHNKGDKNFDKPIYYSGIKFNEGFVVMQGDGDLCSECEKKYNVIHTLIDYIIDHDLPIEIQKNDYKTTKYIKDDIMICYSCKSEMQKSQMGNLPAVMGGYYKGECPHCNAKQLPFGQSHKSTNKHAMILNPSFGSEEVVKAIKQEIEKVNKNSDRKVIFYESSNKANNYFVEIEESNYFRVLVFNTDTKKYNFKSWSNSIGDNFKNIIDSFGYICVDKK